jgi:serine/threonine-protein kinase RsbW
MTSQPATMLTGPVTLTIPPTPAMARVARLTASSIASLADFSVDEIDDIKIAVSEVVTLLIQQGDGDLLTLEFGAGNGPFTIDGSTTSATRPLGDADVALTAAVLDAVSDEHELTTSGDRIVIRVSKSSTSDA